MFTAFVGLPTILKKLNVNLFILVVPIFLSSMAGKNPRLFEVHKSKPRQKKRASLLCNELGQCCQKFLKMCRPKFVLAKSSPIYRPIQGPWKEEFGINLLVCWPIYGFYVVKIDLEPKIAQIRELAIIAMETFRSQICFKCSPICDLSLNLATVNLGKDGLCTDKCTPVARRRKTRKNPRILPRQPSRFCTPKPRPNWSDN